MVIVCAAGTTVVDTVLTTVIVILGATTVVHCAGGAGKRIALQSSLPPTAKMVLEILLHAKILPKAILKLV